MTVDVTEHQRPRSKRTRVLSAATDLFGKNGYENTKWASVADAVGIGQPALYHYFESKAHCLLTIMHIELAESAEQFATATEHLSDPEQALRAAIAISLEASENQVLQRRILQHHMELLITERNSVQEELERTSCCQLTAEIEQNWASLIMLGVRNGSFIDDDPTILARLTLAMVVNVWRWYRPGGRLRLDQIATVTADAVLRLVAP